MESMKRFIMIVIAAIAMFTQSVVLSEARNPQFKDGQIIDCTEPHDCVAIVKGGCTERPGSGFRGIKVKKPFVYEMDVFVASLLPHHPVVPINHCPKCGIKGYSIILGCTNPDCPACPDYNKQNKQNKPKIIWHVL